MLILQLLLKSWQRVDDEKAAIMKASNRIQPDRIWQICSNATLKASRSINQPDGCGLAPGAHDLLATIGETFFVLLTKSANNSSTRHCFEQLEARIAELVSSNREYSMHLLRGVVGCFRKPKIRSKDEFATADEILVRLFKETALNSVLKWRTIDNIHDLKWVKQFSLVLN